MVKYKFADLFSGCGGLALGFQNAGFKSVFAVDIDKPSCETYKLNFKHDVFCGDIGELEEIPVKVDLIIGGPPCQGFSPLGKMTKSENSENNHISLNKLWKHYLRLVEQSCPKAFLIENVPEFLRSREFVLIQKEIQRLNYYFTCGLLNAHDFGVPQIRRRGFVIAIKDKMPALPAPVKIKTTVRDAIGDLPLKPTGNDWHIGRNPTDISLERYKCVPPGGNRFDLMKKRPDITPSCWKNKPTGSTDVFGRLEWDKPSLTVRTEFFKPEKGKYLHPEAHRPITHREAARLQTFPDSFQFVGSKIQVARMIGNAVPPKLAYNLAQAIKKVLNNGD